MHNEFARDSNALNPKFYFELLHILGLKETNEKGKILIQLDPSQNTSFAKHIHDKIREKSPQNSESELFESTMSHIILYLNRILFLKLIEANLLHFNDFDKNLRFLSADKILSFKTLRHLFFEVLAKDYENRESDKSFHFLPYLNSSLFMRDEKEILDLSTFDDDLQILPFSTTQTEYKKDQKVAFLAYLFDFLECWDFGKSEDSASSDKLISSSVLGAMFEKLNGYKEGSFYTPNFITSFMCRESLSKVVCEKFNASFEWNTQDLDALHKNIDRDFDNIESRAKKILRSIRICDPSVGSGHFLISALSEMIYIYHKLGLLGFGYKDLKVIDDEVLLTTKNNENFAYKRFDDENHQIQITLFNLKKSIIENNLFGVDINPNSCNIARLRLWIELLKSAYYLEDGFNGKIHKLQTLPNIDINIKEGNSLISNIDTNITLENFTQNLQERFAKAEKKQDLFLRESLESQIKDTQRKAQIKFKEMRENVEFYKNENDKQASRIYKQKYEESYQYLCNLFKRNCGEYIDFHQALKEFFRRYGYVNLQDLDEEVKFSIKSYVRYFEFDESVNFERKAQREIPQKELENFLNLMKIYESFDKQKTFEWRFAFPEVLDFNGDFLGFDLVIGNPPYIRQEEIKHLKPHLQKAFKIYKGTSDIYTYFFELGTKILKNNGILSFITSNKWCRAAYGEPLREFLLANTTINTYVDLNGIKVFESATVDTSILEFIKGKAPKAHTIEYANPKDYNPKEDKPLEPQYFTIPQDSLKIESFIFSDSKLTALKAKIEAKGTPLKDWDININYGIKTGYNEAFIIDTNKREEILAKCDDSKASLLPYSLSEYDKNLSLSHSEVSFSFLSQKGVYPPPVPLNPEKDAAFSANKGETSLNPLLVQNRSEGTTASLASDFETPRSGREESQVNLESSKIDLENNTILLTERERTAQLIKPILRGRDIKRYSYEWAGLWIIGTFPALKLDIENYPAIKNYLATFGKRLEQSGEKNIDGIRGNNARKKTSNKWFETQDNIAYYNEFSKPKIVWNPVSGEYFFTYIKEVMYMNNSVFMITHKQNKEDFLLYVLGCMNSTLYRWLITQMTNLIDEGKYAYGAKDKLEKLPMPKISKAQEKEFIEIVQQILETKKANEDANELEKCLDSKIFALYDLNDEEIAIIAPPLS